MRIRKLKDKNTEQSRRRKFVRSIILTRTAVAAAAFAAGVCIAVTVPGEKDLSSENMPDLSEYEYDYPEETAEEQAADDDTVYDSAERPQVRDDDTDNDTDKVSPQDSVTVTADGVTKTVAALGTVSDVLEAAGVNVGKNDIINMEPDDTVAGGDDIVVNRVVYYKRTRVKTLKYSTEYHEDTDLPAGERVVVSDGESGELTVKQIIKTVDGEEVDSKTLSREVTAEPVNRIISVGVGNASAENTDDEDEADTGSRRKSAKVSDITENSSADDEYEDHDYDYDSDKDEEDDDHNSYDEDDYRYEDLYPDDSDDDNDSEETYTDEDDEYIIDSDDGYYDTDYDGSYFDDQFDDFLSEGSYDDGSYEEYAETNDYNDSDDDASYYSGSVICISQLTPDREIKLGSDGVPVNYSQALHGKSCAYTAEPGALMSTGKTVDQGYVAVNPNIIPYGSKLYIIADDGEVYGYAIAADTGGSVGRNDILVDLFMWSYDECMQWGAKNVTIYVIE